MLIAKFVLAFLMLMKVKLIYLITAANRIYNFIDGLSDFILKIYC